MDDKDIIKNLFKDIYNIQIRYLYIPLDEYFWEHLVREMGELRNKYKEHGANIDQLCRDMIYALTSYKERKDKDGNQKKADQRKQVQKARADGSGQGIWRNDQ